MNTPQARTVILGAVLAFILLLGILTLKVIINGGVNVLELISLLVLSMFAFGIVGALRNPPE